MRPRFTDWLLENGVSRECLVGDLAEEHAHGRSDAWYVRQVFQAIVLEGYAEVREHKLMTLRAIAAGLALIFMWKEAFKLLNWWMTLLASPDRDSKIALWAILFAGLFVITWLISLFHRLPTLFAFLGFLLLAGMIGDLGLRPHWLPPLSEPLSMFAPIEIAAVSSCVLIRFLFHSRMRGGSKPEPYRLAS